MLKHQEHPMLIETLYAILIILPQGLIADCLKNRLEISKITMGGRTVTEPSNGGSVEGSSMVCSRRKLISDEKKKLVKEYLECQNNFVASTK
jgi:hypothetical protein